MTLLCGRSTTPVSGWLFRLCRMGVEPTVSLRMLSSFTLAFPAVDTLHLRQLEQNPSEQTHCSSIAYGHGYRVFMHVKPYVG